MSTTTLISSNFFKKSIPLSNKTLLLLSSTISNTKLTTHQYHPTQTCTCVSTGLRKIQAHDPTYIPGKSPPEVPTAPPSYSPGIPPEMPQRPGVPEFDPDKPVDPPPISPDPGPGFPGGPPKPDIPSQPEVVPPHGPDVNPPEPGPSQPSQPDIPTPIMGSNGLVFY